MIQPAKEKFSHTSLISQKGFTLIEMMLSIAIITLLFGLSTPIYQSFQVRNDLDIAATTIVQSLRRAQVLSQAVDGETNWGVNVKSGSITIFKGVSYDARDGEYDELFQLPSTISRSGLGEVVFDTVTGLPQATGTITLVSSIQESRNITLNEKGTVTY